MISGPTKWRLMAFRRSGQWVTQLVTQTAKEAIFVDGKLHLSWRVTLVLTSDLFGMNEITGLSACPHLAF